MARLTILPTVPPAIHPTILPTIRISKSPFASKRPYPLLRDPLGRVRSTVETSSTSTVVPR